MISENSANTSETATEYEQCTGTEWYTSSFFQHHLPPYKIPSIDGSVSPPRGIRLRNGRPRPRAKNAGRTPVRSWAANSAPVIPQFDPACLGGGYDMMTPMTGSSDTTSCHSSPPHEIKDGKIVEGSDERLLLHQIEAQIAHLRGQLNTLMDKQEDIPQTPKLEPFIPKPNKRRTPPPPPDVADLGIGLTEFPEDWERTGGSHTAFLKRSCAAPCRQFYPSFPSAAFAPSVNEDQKRPIHIAPEDMEVTGWRPGTAPPNERETKRVAKENKRKKRLYEALGADIASQLSKFRGEMVPEHVAIRGSKKKWLFNAYESIVAQLKEEETHLRQGMREYELEMTRGAKPYWWELDSKQFTSELTRHNRTLRHEWRETDKYRDHLVEVSHIDGFPSTTKHPPPLLSPQDLAMRRCKAKTRDVGV